METTPAQGRKLRKLKRLSVLAAFIILSLFGILALRFGSTQIEEPEYRGKALSHWLEMLVLGPETKWSFVNDAIQAMGTNCLPHLQRRLLAKDNILKRAVIRWFPRLNDLNMTRDTFLQHQAALALPMLGSNAVPVLVVGLRDERSLVRRQSLNALMQIGKQAVAAVPELRNILNSTNAVESQMARETLRRIVPKERY